MSYSDPLAPPAQLFTTWVNPTERPVHLDLHVGSSVTNKSGRVRYTVPTRGEATIPSEFDLGIQDVRNGEVVGGLGPMLIRKDNPAVVAGALDANRSRAKEAALEAEQALMAQRAAESAVLAAVAKGEEAKAALRATQDIVTGVPEKKAK